jgi:hypothetical protein
MEQIKTCPHLVVDKFGHCEHCFDMLPEYVEAVQTSAPTPTIEAENLNYYRAAYADGDGHGFRVCDHRHQTICSATACISAAGGYVVAVKKGKLQALTSSEEAEVQAALSGTFISRSINILDHLLAMMLANLGHLC